jgi:mono/diheme cytochrome c family protein
VPEQIAMPELAPPGRTDNDYDLNEKYGGVMSKSTYFFLFILAVPGWVVFGNTMIFPGSAALSAQAADGANLYAIHCGACHAAGGNIITPSLPVTGSTKMKSLAVFSAFNRNPLKADGSKGIMPAFPRDKISDQEMKLIFDYSLTLPGAGK